MRGERGRLPKAYLRVDPNIDQTHPRPGDMLVLLCIANRQPCRGHFKSAEQARHVLGRGLYQRSVQGGDLVALPDGRLYVDGWEEWQEGDWTVGDRMRRLRNRHSPVSGP